MERIQAKTKVNQPTYNFKGEISNCIELYMSSYADQEEQSIKDGVDQILQQLGKESLESMFEYKIDSSSLHLFKNIKSSLKRCMSFSTSKTLMGVYRAIKNSLRHYVN